MPVPNKVQTIPDGTTVRLESPYRTPHHMKEGTVRTFHANASSGPVYVVEMDHLVNGPLYAYDYELVVVPEPTPEVPQLKSTSTYIVRSDYGNLDLRFYDKYDTLIGTMSLPADKALEFATRIITQTQYGLTDAIKEGKL